MKRRQVQRWSPKSTETDDDVVRTRCALDLKFLFQAIINHGNPEFQNSTGYIHDILFDFIRFEEDIPTEYRHTCLHEYVSELEEGQEAWIYWPVLYKKTADGFVYKKPEVYLGRDHQLYRDWIEHKLIRGVLIRIAGDGNWKTVLFPRDHLKSTIGRAEVLQDIIRDSASRTMYRTSEAPLAEQFVSAVKFEFDRNPEFIKYFGSLKPEYKEEVWAKNAFQVVSDVRRGIDPTLWAAAMTTDVTGFHPEKGVFDDIVTLKNLNEQDKMWKKYQAFTFVLARKYNQIRNWGTRYSENDCWGNLVMPSGDPDGEIEPFDLMSFAFATLRDCDNNLIWPEGFTDKDERDKRAMCRDDHQWFSQYYNNPYMHSNRTLKDDWRRWYEATPESMAEKHQLDIVITIDPAHTTNKDSDYTAVMVQGQTQDRTQRYVLDGLREKLTEDELPVAITDLIEKWDKIRMKYGGGFKIAIESVTYQTYIKFGLRNEARERGIPLPDVIPVKPESRGKNDRIKVLVAPYSKGCIVWPRKLPKVSKLGHAYDFIEVLYGEWSKWPRPQAHDDVLDVQAYAEDLFLPLLFKEEKKESVPIEQQAVNWGDDGARKHPSAQTRQEALEAGDQSTGGRFIPPNLRARPATLYIPPGMRSRQ